MPKVISVLEELEDFATRFDSEGREVVTLQVAVHRLELEKLDRANDKKRNEKDIDQLQDTWQSETRELYQLIDRLKEENTSLKMAIKEKREKQDASVKTRQSAESSVEEIQLMLRLKEVIDRQKVELRDLRRQLSQKDVDLDAMQQQAVRLAKLNAVLRRRHCVCKRQSDQLLAERTELESLLQTKTQLIQQMRDHISSPRSAVDNGATPGACGMSTSMLHELASPGTPPSQITESQLIERLNAEDRMISPMPGPQSPRFTMQELRDLMTERNELQSRLIGVEEELSVYHQAGDNDPPVQGPINREPEEKTHGRSARNSGITIFFQSLFNKLAN